MSPQEFSEAWRALFPPHVLAHVERQRRLALVRCRGFVEGGPVPPEVSVPCSTPYRAGTGNGNGEPSLHDPPAPPPDVAAIKAEVLGEVMQEVKSLLLMTLGSRNGTGRAGKAG